MHPMQRISIAGILLLVTAQAWTAGLAAPAESTAPNAALASAGAARTLTQKVRIKDIARVQSARENQLLGYGLVVGLNGTGDSTKSEFTALALSSMLQKLGVTEPASHISVKNVAAVIVTATIGPFLKSGDHLDVVVSSLSDASSLQGGMLLQTPMTGADGNVYAVAQGPVSLGGFSASGGGASAGQGHPTAGRIPAGALIEREIKTALAPENTLSLSLNYPDFTTATRMAKAINDDLDANATPRDANTVDIPVPIAYRTRLVELVARVEEQTLAVDTPAKVVINERTGTVIIGGSVTVSPVAVAQGNLSITINPDFFVSQPTWLSQTGTTVEKTTATVTASEPTVSMTIIQGSTVDELVRTLNYMKVSPRDIIAILQAMKRAGALQAEMEIM